MKRTATIKNSVPDNNDVKFTEEHWKKAQYLVAGKKVTKEEWQIAARAQLAEQLAQQSGKQRISIMLDNAVIEHFRAAAGARGYQTLINEALKKFISGETLASELRTVLREELAAYKVK